MEDTGLRGHITHDKFMVATVKSNLWLLYKGSDCRKLHMGVGGHVLVRGQKPLRPPVGHFLQIHASPMRAALEQMTWNGTERGPDLGEAQRVLELERPLGQKLPAPDLCSLYPFTVPAARVGCHPPAEASGQVQGIP